MHAFRQLLNECGIGVSDDQQNHSSSKNDIDGVVQRSAIHGTHRILIFAQLKKVLDLIENTLFREYMPSVTFLRLDGTCVRYGCMYALDMYVCMHPYGLY